MPGGFHIGPLSFGRRAARERSAPEAGPPPAKHARGGNPVLTYTGTVTGQEPGSVLVRVTSGSRGADQALIGDTIRVSTHDRFTVWTAVEVRLSAADQSLVSIRQVS